MRIFITGATGFIGRALVLRLQRDGHQVVAWVRSPERAADQLAADVALVPVEDGDLALYRAVAASDAVVNLAGEPIFGGRWTRRRRERLVASRVDLTRRLVGAIAAAKQPPRVLVSASAVGFYGDRREELLDERSSAGDDFLAALCDRWEAEAARARSLGVRVAIVRIGIVLGAGGGALSAMLPAFRAGVGGPLGSGRQFMPWIHLRDLVEVFATAIADDRLRGAVNAVAPTPVSNRTFSRALGRALGRPALLRVPGVALRVLLGKASSALLASQCAIPRALREIGYGFRFATIDAALDDLVGRDAGVSIAREDGRYVLRQRTLVDAPIDRVFAFFARAENLGVMTPPELSFSIETPRPIEMAAGVRIDYRVRLGPIPLRWRTRIDAWEPGRSFVDVQERGPYRSWHHEHRFIRLGDRTIMEDTVVYRPPFGWLGRLIHRAFIARSLRNIFAHRAAAIRLRFGSSDSPSARAA